MAETKAKGLFDHLKAITSKQDPNYWDTLTEGDKKTFSNFMIHRFLSMEYDFIETIADLQQYTEILQPKELYLFYIGLLPKGNRYNKYIKGKGEDKFEPWLVDLIKIDYLCSKREAIEYCEILYATPAGREHLKYICEKYGTEPKMIKKLKLK